MKNKKLNFFQFFKFCVVGVSNTIVSLGTYYVLIWINFHYIVANTCGFIASVINAYYWNRKYVFNKTQKGNIKPLLKTFISYGITFLLSNLMLLILIDKYNVSQLVAPVICIIVTTPINFVFNKLWAFK